jgi:hypothetical protein
MDGWVGVKAVLRIAYSNKKDRVASVYNYMVFLVKAYTKLNETG